MRVNPSVAPRQGPIKGESSICFDGDKGAEIGYELEKYGHFSSSVGVRHTYIHCYE